MMKRRIIIPCTGTGTVGEESTVGEERIVGDEEREKVGGWNSRLVHTVACSLNQDDVLHWWSSIRHSISWLDA
jgi:hypothetical protein